MTTLYKKRGRRYIPVQERWYESDEDRMTVGTFRLTYCYTKGGRRYQYEVTPATATWAAAAMIARDVMVEAMKKRAVATPSDPVPYTKKQQQIIKRFRKEMSDAGGLLPSYWQHASPFDIADAAIKALEEWKP